MPILLLRRQFILWIDRCNPDNLLKGFQLYETSLNKAETTDDNLATWWWDPTPLTLQSSVAKGAFISGSISLEVRSLKSFF